MTEQEMQDMIDRVADRFEQASSTSVLPSARKALLIPAVPHMNEVTRDLEMQKITPQVLEASLQKVLENALAEIQKRNLASIDDNAVQQSMERLWTSSSSR